MAIDSLENPAHPFRTPVLGTVEQGACRLRTVILRGANPVRRQLLCYTDSRSGKARQIQADARTSWHFYHTEEKLQMRARGKTSTHVHDELANTHWKGIGARGRKDYAALLAPGSRAPHPTRAVPKTPGEGPSAEDLAYAFKNFMVLCTTVAELDLLLLHPDGHQRVGARWENDHWAYSWIVA